MARKSCRPKPTVERVLQPLRRRCPSCGQRMQVQYHNYRTVTTLKDVVRLTLKIRRCVNVSCASFHKPYRPEGEGALALPEYEFGLDVIALVGSLRFQNRMTVPEIHMELVSRNVIISERSVTNLLERYEELLALHLKDDGRLRDLLSEQKHAILAIDGIQPDNGHEVLWVIREILSGEVLLARTLLSARQAELGDLLDEVKRALPIPVGGVVSDGQRSLRNAIEKSLPGVPYQLCQFHYLREAARPIHEADRHAKKELKKRVRGIRGIEREVENRGDPSAELVSGYCAGVRGAITDGGRPPLAASGLLLRKRLSDIATSLDRLTKKRAVRKNSTD